MSNWKKLDAPTSQARKREREKTMLQYAPPKKAQNRGQNDFKKRPQSSSSRNPVEIYGVDADFTLFKTFIGSLVQSRTMAETSETTFV